MRHHKPGGEYSIRLAGASTRSSERCGHHDPRRVLLRSRPEGGAAIPLERAGHCARESRRGVGDPAKRETPGGPGADRACPVASEGVGSEADEQRHPPGKKNLGRSRALKGIAKGLAPS